MSDQWVLAYDELDEEREGLREALCTLGNGIFATRGCAEEQGRDDTHYPGHYVAGGYNELASEVAGRTVVNEDLVNFPNWLWLSFRAVGARWLDLWQMEVLDFEQRLDMRTGVLERSLRVRDGDGRVTALETRRLVHMEHHHLAAIQWKLRPENWSGHLEIESGLDGSVTNENVERYRQLEGKHLDVIDRGPIAPEGIHLKVRTKSSDIEMAQGARTRVFGIDRGRLRRFIDTDDPERICEHLKMKVEQGREITVEKTVAQFTSRDRGIGNHSKKARIAVDDAPDFDVLLDSHMAAWKRLWHRCDVEVEVHDNIEGPDHDQLILRLHIFHLLQTASPNTAGRDVGIPARGLHGEAYRGHIFWDELFILPFYALRLPSVARSTILYRYYRLDAARNIARQAGCEGACFPWQSGADGREVTQELHLNPMSGDWDPDYSNLQRHINSAIVYNIWNYYQATGDRAFIEEYGAEIVLEIAHFWSSLADYDADSERYEICGVMGPDEYHEKYPDADTGGLDNNVYTNITAVWCLLRALDLLDVMADRRAAELLDKLAIDDATLERWDHISRRMKVVFHDGVMSQFEGYSELDEFDWQAYTEQYGNIERLDRILKAEDDSPDHYKVSKQADVTMLFFLFRSEEIQSLMQRLGYEFGEEDMRRNVAYYRARTSHGSTLSRVVYTSAVHRHNCEEGAKLFLQALESDLCDIQGGTTQEGIHLGAMADTVDIVKRHYAGLQLTPGGLAFFPHLPKRMKSIAFRVQHHGRWYAVKLDETQLEVELDAVEDQPVTIQVEDETHQIEPGTSVCIDIEHPTQSHAIELGDDETGDMAPPLDIDGSKQRPRSAESHHSRGQ